MVKEANQEFVAGDRVAVDFAQAETTIAVALDEQDPTR